MLYKTDMWWLRKAVIDALKPFNRNMYLASIVKVCGLSRSLTGRVLRQLVCEGVVNSTAAKDLPWEKDRRLANIYQLNSKYPAQRKITLAFPRRIEEIMLAGVKVMPLSEVSDYTCSYYPAYVTDGHVVSARAVCRVGISHNTMDEAGYVVTAWAYEDVSFWNNKTSDPGMGLADFVCKQFGPGREVSLSGSLVLYNSVVVKGNRRSTTKKRGIVCASGSIVLGSYEHPRANNLDIHYKTGDKTYGYAEVAK